MFRSRIRSDHLLQWMLAPYAAFCVLCIVFIRFTKTETGGMLLPASLVLFVSYGIFMAAARKRVARFVKMYVSTQFFINAVESSGNALRRVFRLSVPLTLVTIIFAEPFALLTTGSVRARMALTAAAFIFFLHGINGVLGGFAEGCGMRRLILVSDALRASVVPCAAFFAARAGYRYGERVDRMLVTNDCCAAYGALYLVLTIVLCELLFLFFFTGLRIITRKKLFRSKKGKPRYLGEEPALFSQAGHMMAVFALPFLLCAVAAFSIAQAGKGAPGGGEALHAVSVFAGHVMSVLMLVAAAGVMRFCGACYRLPGAENEIETGGMAQRYARLLHRMSLLVVPYGAFLMVLSKPLDMALFASPEDRAPQMFLSGAFLAPAFVYAATGALLMVLTKRKKQLLVLSGITLVAGSVLLVVAGRIAMLDPYGVPAGMVIAVLVFCSGCYVLLADLIGVPRALVFSMLPKPLALSAASALLMYPLSGELVHLIGEMATCLVCILAGCVLYLVLMAVFRGLKQGDLRAVPGGGALVKLSMRR